MRYKKGVKNSFSVA